MIRHFTSLLSASRMLRGYLHMRGICNCGLCPVVEQLFFFVACVMKDYLNSTICIIVSFLFASGKQTGQKSE